MAAAVEVVTFDGVDPDDVAVANTAVPRTAEPPTVYGVNSDQPAWLDIVSVAANVLLEPEIKPRKGPTTV